MKDRNILLVIALLTGGIFVSLIVWHVQAQRREQELARKAEAAQDLYFLDRMLAASGYGEVERAQAKLEALKSGTVKQRLAELKANAEAKHRAYEETRLRREAEDNRQRLEREQSEQRKAKELAEAKGLVVMGIILPAAGTSQGPTAMLQDTEQLRTHVVKVGDDIKGMHVKAINAEGVVLSDEGKELLLHNE